MTFNQIILIRHAEAAPSQRNIPHADKLRTLTEHGKTYIPHLSQQLQQLGWTPQLALISSAQRTRETWQLLSPTFSIDLETHFLEDLYNCTLEDMLNIINQEKFNNTAEELNTLLIVGHNPTLEEMIMHLTGEFVTLAPEMPLVANNTPLQITL